MLSQAMRMGQTPANRATTTRSIKVTGVPSWVMKCKRPAWIAAMPPTQQQPQGQAGVEGGETEQDRLVDVDDPEIPGLEMKAH
jgi:hypothetical protein